MMDELARRPSNSIAPGSRVRCINHVINLVAHTITNQFDAAVKKKKKNSAANDEDDAEEDADEPSEEEQSLPAALDQLGLEDWVDDLENMSEAELKQFIHDSAPVRKVLVKVVD